MRKIIPAVLVAVAGVAATALHGAPLPVTPYLFSMTPDTVSLQFIEEGDIDTYDEEGMPVLQPAAYYEVRISTVPPPLPNEPEPWMAWENWEWLDTMETYAGALPVPGPVGGSATIVLAGLDPSTLYHVVVMTYDNYDQNTPSTNILSFTTMSPDAPPPPSTGTPPPASGGSDSSAGGCGGSAAGVGLLTAALGIAALLRR